MRRETFFSCSLSSHFTPLNGENEVVLNRTIRFPGRGCDFFRNFLGFVSFEAGNRFFYSRKTPDFWTKLDSSKKSFHFFFFGHKKGISFHFLLLIYIDIDKEGILKSPFLEETKRQSNFFLSLSLCANNRRHLSRKRDLQQTF